MQRCTRVLRRFTLSRNGFKAKRNCIQIERSDNIIENNPSAASSYRSVAG